jgi:S-adenosylmethionine synthetase
MLGNIFGCTSGRLAVKVHRDDRFMQYQHRYMQVEVVAANFLTHCFCQFSACMHQGYRLSIMSIYIYFEACIRSKNYCQYVYMVCVFVQHFCKKLVVFEVQKNCCCI